MQRIDGRPLIIAHRGASSLAPENTMAAFQEAYLRGADVVEVDVRRSQDGHLVVMHDATVERTTDGQGRIADLTLAQIRALDAGHWFGPHHIGEKVPTLEEVLDWARGRVRVAIEAKEPGLEGPIVAAVRQRQMEDQVLVMSFDRQFVQRVKAAAPDIAAGTLFAVGPQLRRMLQGTALGAALGAGLSLLGSVSPLAAAGLTLAGGLTGYYLSRRAAQADILEKAASLGADVILPFWSTVDKSFVEQAHQRGLKVLAYTANNPRLVQKLLTHAGVDGIITDNPERYAETGSQREALATERRLQALQRLPGVASARAGPAGLQVTARDPAQAALLGALLAVPVSPPPPAPPPGPATAAALLRKYGQHLEALPGVVGLGTDLASGALLTYVETPEARELLQGLLRPTLEGVPLQVVQTRGRVYA